MLIITKRYIHTAIRSCSKFELSSQYIKHDKTEDMIVN